MRTTQALRIAALVAAIVLCLALALGACMAKRTADGGSTVSTGKPGTGGTPPPSPTDEVASRKDAGVKKEPNKPPPPPPRGRRSVPTKANKGMVGMNLEGGD